MGETADAGPPKGGKASVRSQARGVRSREQILDAAVECLMAHGYADTTTQRVQDLAGVSRGRLLYHFPNKSELIAAAVAHVADQRLGIVDHDAQAASAAVDDGALRRAYGPQSLAGEAALRPAASSGNGGAGSDTDTQISEAMAEFSDPYSRVAATVHGLWASFSEPIFWAAVETWTASRTDPDLARLTRGHERIVMRRVRETNRMILGPKLSALPQAETALNIVFTSMRGVAMTYAFSGRDMGTEPMLDTWTDLLLQLLDVEV